MHLPLTGRDPTRILLAALVAIALLATTAAADLTADGLVLIVNRNEPAGRELADYYAKARGVPDGRIIELDLPTGDWLPRDDWDPKVVAPVRDFLEAHDLQRTVRCAVTFYGVPLGVEGVRLTDAERAERREIDADADVLRQTLVPVVRQAERVTFDLGNKPPSWPTDGAPGLEETLTHLQAAQAYLQQRAPSMTPAEQQSTAAAVLPIRQTLADPAEPGGQRMSAEAIKTLLARDDAEGRRAARAALRTGAPLGQYAVVVLAQQRRLDDAESDASFDNELATLWLGRPPRSKWLPNPLAQPAAANPNANPNAGAGAPAERGILMVARLDGRDPAQARRLVDDALAAEQNGLAGKIVVDSRGLRPQGADGTDDAYAVFDEQLRQLAAYLQKNATLPVVADDRPDVIAPLPGVDGAAVYVGWYSLQNYVPGVRLVPGAVGYHVASLEMRSLRSPSQLGWVRGLLDDGVAATLGPVSEPYLATFPPPGRFVPLLLSGRLPLAEVYWRTTPCLSWKMGLIGDPLYRPFAAKPALPPEKLPPEVAALME